LQGVQFLHQVTSPIDLVILEVIRSSPPAAPSRGVVEGVLAGPDYPAGVGIVRSQLVTPDWKPEVIAGSQGPAGLRGVRRPGGPAPLRWLRPALALLVLATSCSVRVTPGPGASSGGPAPTQPAGPTQEASPRASSPAPTGKVCDADGPWELRLTVTGGLAGVERELTLDQSGAYQAFDRQGNIGQAGVFASDLMTEVVAQLPAACVHGGGQRPPACADCFTYALEVTLQSGRYQVLLNDANLGQVPAGGLVSLLSQLLGSALDS